MESLLSRGADLVERAPRGEQVQGLKQGSYLLIGAEISRDLVYICDDTMVYFMRDFCFSTDLATLRARWDNINARARDRHAKLQEAADKADSFHGDLNSFISWLTSTEKNLNNLKPVSRVLHHINDQIEEHKLLQKDISAHREVMVSLDKTGTSVCPTVCSQPKLKHGKTCLKWTLCRCAPKPSFTIPFTIILLTNTSQVRMKCRGKFRN